MPINKKGVQHPITPYDKQYTYQDTIGKHPSVLRQMYLDSNNMSTFAQARIHNDPALTIEIWRTELQSWI